jgi:hypothetical protein
MAWMLLSLPDLPASGLHGFYQKDVLLRYEEISYAGSSLRFGLDWL